MPPATKVGLALLYLYPWLLLAYDAWLKYGLKAPTISDLVWSDRDLMGLTCLYLTTWCCALDLHLGGKFFDY